VRSPSAAFSAESVAHGARSYFYSKHTACLAPNKLGRAQTRPQQRRSPLQRQQHWPLRHQRQRWRLRWFLQQQQPLSLHPRPQQRGLSQQRCRRSFSAATPVTATRCLYPRGSISILAAFLVPAAEQRQQKCSQQQAQQSLSTSTYAMSLAHSSDAGASAFSLQLQRHATRTLLVAATATLVLISCSATSTETPAAAGKRRFGSNDGGSSHSAEHGNGALRRR
jgi:hypothetical protein